MRSSIHKLKWGLFSLIDGDFISQFARTYGEWTEAEVQFFRSILTPTSNVIEVGSNLGMHAVPIATMIEKGKLFCFEPQRIIFQMLCGNLALNQLTNVFAYNHGVSNQEGVIEITSSNYETPWNYGSFSLDKGFNTEGHFDGIENKEYLNVISIDNHKEIQKLTTLALLKIDAEGFERPVLAGAKETIQKHKPIIFLEAHPQQAKNLIAYLQNMDYKCYWFISDRYQPNNYFKQAKTISGLDYNLACFHQSVTANLPDKLLACLDTEFDQIPLITC